MSKLQQVLETGNFAVTAEIGPPKHASAEGVRHHAHMMKDYVDATNITDCQTAIVRISSIATGVHVMDCGIEPIVQMTCRDRNRIAMQADMLGAYSLGMRNLLCLSGDHQKFGNHPTSKNVYDVDSMQLIYLVKRMRDEKKFFSGEEIKEHEPQFFIGAVANPFADPFEFRVDRLEKKVEAGAQFIQTQCIFDMERFERFMEMVRERGLHERTHILAGVTPLKSWRGAKYMQSNVSGMIVPEEIVQRLKSAEDPKKEGVDLCIEQINYIKDNIKGVHGVHVMAIAWEEIIPEIVQRCGLYPRPKFED
ncbi:MAG: methylenetetrahydrofolate reductase [Peptococcaceae bacterium BRH_c4b]|nr:MAG: methylenetetrahydrofolate reductase [Peptococcaceae bacterium BRH_c4b]